MEASIEKDRGNSGMVSITLYHASDRVVDIPDIKFPGPRENCDFGNGFYLAENKYVAEEWVIRKPLPIINVYHFEAPKKEILYLDGADWVKTIVGFRERAYKVHFKSPVVCGHIANDRMNDALPIFMQGIIGDLRLLKCLNYCNLGNQYLLRGPTGFLTFERSYNLKGLELQRAIDRYYIRRQDMSSRIQSIYEEQIPGEKFLRHYLAEGDYIEP